MAQVPKYSGCNIGTTLAEKRLDTDLQLWRRQIDSVTPSAVQQALAQAPGCYDLQRLIALVSPAAEDYLEQMAQQARQLTLQRFGRTVRLYAPLYLSNFCINSCRYCGFNKQSKSRRTRLTVEQALAEADIIAAEGFRDILLVSSEDKEFITIDYLAALAARLRDKFCCVSIEVYQVTTDQYARLFAAGIEGVTLYQETYNRQTYQHYHRAGPKADYNNRLAAPDSIAAAGMRQIGLGVLLGLADWRVETLALAEHAHYLIKKYWQSRVSVSFPRLRPAADVSASQFKHLLTDKNLVQMILALRLCFANVGLVLSTREPGWLRDHLVDLGITKISAGSKTNPGGYSRQTNAVEQFQIDDTRTPAQIAQMLKEKNLEPVWKDWDTAFTQT